MLILLLLILPFAFACLMLTSSSRDNSVFRMGLLCSAVPLILATVLIALGGQQTDIYPWFSISGIDIEFSLYGHGLSLWMVWLTTLLSFLAFVYSKEILSFGIKKFTIGLLILEGTIIGAFFSAHNIVQFLFFFEAMILPTAILISSHGGLKRRKAIITFSIYTLAGSVPLLFGVWYLMLKAGSDNINFLTKTLETLPLATQISLLIAFSITFAVKIPIFPFHSWQGITYSEAPYSLSAILSGAMAKVGIFGFAIWVIPLFEEFFKNTEYSLRLISIALFSMLYGAILALKQTNIKRLLAFSSMSHLSLALAGLFCIDRTVNAGVAVMLVGHGLTAGGLFFFGSIAQKWTGSTNIKHYGAFASTNPIYATIFGFLGIAAIAIPSTVGFVGEFLILRGLFNTGSILTGFIFAVVGCVGIILSAAYMLRLIKHTLFGSIPKNTRSTNIYLSQFEGVAAIPVIVLIFYFGLHPAPIFNSFKERVEEEDTTELPEYEKILEEALTIDSLTNDSLGEHDDR
jgi:NADH-quinone oxidoreductase subunit M